MPPLSKYHAIRFVLEDAYADKASGGEVGEDAWGAWFARVSRVFGRRIPDALLDGLSGRCEALRRLCEAHRAGRPQAAARESSWRQRHADWVIRRDAGNARVAAERRRAREQASVAAAAQKSVDDERKWESMMPVWHERLRKIEETRAQEERVWVSTTTMPVWREGTRAAEVGPDNSNPTTGGA